LSVSGLSLEGILDLLHQLLVALDVRNQIELDDRVGRDVRRLILEAAMHVDMLEVLRPDRVSESLDRVELLPFRVFSLVDLHEHILAHSVGSASEDDHQGPNENGGMLISR